jgi:hypothetical protein
MLIKKLNSDIIEHIYLTEVPTDYAAFKTKAILADSLLRISKHNRLLCQGKQSSYTPTASTSQTGDRRTATGVTYGGSGQAMDMSVGRFRIDKSKATAEGLCSKCGKKGHMARYCPNTKKNTPTPQKRQDKGRHIREIYESMTQEERTTALEDFQEI